MRAGPLELLYEQGELRAVRLGGRELIRRIYVAIRDGNWGTIPVQFSQTHIQAGETAFAIDFAAENRQGEIDFAWRGSLRGTPQGRITFSMDGAAQTTFWKNRIGFCVLFPASLAGQAAQIEHIDGTRELAVFPVDISAEQPVRPFESLRGLTLPLGAQGHAALLLEGEEFEMEDQRLWTDASYKVFGTPLALPYPAQIQAGTRVAQSLSLTVQAEAQPARRRGAKPPAPPDLRPPAEADWRPLPLLGLGAASHGEELSSSAMERLRALRLHHLRVDLPLADPTCPQRLERAAREAMALGIALEAALFIEPERAESDLLALRGLLERLHPPLCAFLVYPAQEIYAGGSPTEAVLAAALRHLQDYRPRIPFAAGTNTDYIFLKRSPPPTARMDRVCIALNPQVHAFDDLSLLQTLEAQPMVVESARRLAGGLPVMVSPITLKPRFNPYASAPPTEPLPGELPPQVDPRQRSLFAAAWTLGSLRGMIDAGAASLTFYETTGWRGVMERAGGSPWPQSFPRLPGIVFPLYHLLADVGEFSGGQAAPLASTGENAGALIALALRREGRLALLLANPTPAPQSLRLAGWPGLSALRRLDENNAAQATRAPDRFRREPLSDLTSSLLTLLPYACLRLEGPERAAFSGEKQP